MTGAANPSLLLDVRDLSVRFKTARGLVTAVENVSFSVAPGETLAIVGESGSGKSSVGLGIIGLLAKTAECRVEGKVNLAAKNGGVRDLLTLPESQMREIRGNDVAMIFQEPMSSLNPVYRIGSQIVEAIRLHQRVDAGAARRRALELVETLAIANPARCLDLYPHQLSGGMRQRVMIAMALSCRPRLLIADEPTTALDVTIQAQIVTLLKRLQQQTGMALVFITHNLGLVSEIADRAAVMYAGQIVEEGPIGALFGAPRMPYTAGLMRSLPRLGQKRARGERLQAIPGNVPTPLQRPPGCAFHPRCADSRPGRCDTQAPALEPCGDGRHARCLRWRELAAEATS